MRLMAWMLGDLPQDAELQKELRIQQAIMLVRQLPILFIANPLCAALMVVAFWTKADRLFLLGWMVATFALWSLPIASWLRLRNRPRPGSVSPRKERHAAVFSVIAGCLWAVALVVLFPLATPDEQALMSLEICGLMAGALACLPSLPRSCLAYAMPMYAAGVTQWLPLDQSPLHALSFIVVAFGLAVIVFVYNNWQAFVANVTIIVERARLLDQQAEEIARRRKAEAELQASLAQLRATQSQLLVQEKMASLGQLTAGIAHEIKNPLNFVNNFAELSTELLDELDEVLGRQASPERDAEVASLVHMLSGNMQKIADHGRRGDSIIKSMLLHSRGGSGEWRLTNLNALLEESLNLAYHGARARDQDFNISLERDLDPDVGTLDVVPQDVTRVFLNLFSNGFHAAHARRKATDDPAYRPILKVSSRDLGESVEVRVHDNGIGISPGVRARLFTPFFTTKPTGEGTGLGLSLSYDIVVQQHRGTIRVESREYDYTDFIVTLPRRPRLGRKEATSEKVTA